MEGGGELSIIELILEATIPVQIVMLILAGFSVVSWALIILRSLELRRTARDNGVFENRFWDTNPQQLAQELHAEYEASGKLAPSMTMLFYDGMEEFAKRKQGGATMDAVMNSVERVLRVSVTREGERLEQWLPFLATVASVSPYIGLFGTVWGIMNSFISLAGVQQATLNTVAPGIAEALIATAIGLFAAIPALIAFNRFSVVVQKEETAVSTFSQEMLTMLHRES